MAEVYRVYRHYAISNQPALPDDAADLLKPEDWVWKNLAVVHSNSKSMFAILSLFSLRMFCHRRLRGGGGCLFVCCYKSALSVHVVVVIF